MEPINDTLLEAEKQKLTPRQYHVTQEAGTEPPFQNEYWNQHESGLYVDVVSGEPLFSSKEKFDSGSGWPSFWKPLEPANVVEHTDRSLGMARTEVRSRRAGSHLGHLFDDGPRPTGQRYCINSAALRFIPAAHLTRAGYGEYAKLFPEVTQMPLEGNVSSAQASDFSAAAKAAATKNRAGVATNHEVAVVGGGCFWGMQALLRKVPGVVQTEVGYAGGREGDATYPVVCSGESGHAESVKIVFDPKTLSYENLMVYFFKIHDPTTPNRQHNDVGTQYRSVIFAQSPEQLRVARAVKERAERSHAFLSPVVTEIVPAAAFFDAEDYHQDYLVKNPNGYTCHVFRDVAF